MSVLLVLCSLAGQPSGLCKNVNVGVKQCVNVICKYTVLIKPERERGRREREREGGRERGREREGEGEREREKLDGRRPGEEGLGLVREQIFIGISSNLF